MFEDFGVPTRGFNTAEFKTRVDNVQKIMEKNDLGCILITSQEEVYYFTGFITQFWQSPTRPWYLVVPKKGKPIAVIPSIGKKLMSCCYVSEVRSWDSPALDDDGLSILKKTLKENVKGSNKIGIMLGRETSLRMPAKDILSIFSYFGADKIFDVTQDIQKLRMIKSEAEIKKIKYICKTVSKVFSEMPSVIKIGIPLSEIFRQFKILCLSEGMDDVSYLVGAADQSGYFDIIAPPSDKLLEAGDILMMDTGTKWDGYFCDFDRNFAIGQVHAEAHKVHKILYDSIDSAVKEIKPGVSRVNEIFTAIDSVLSAYSKSRNKPDSSVGRFGHGVGIQLTEPPSIISWDKTIIKVGMTLTLEPSLVYGDKNRMMVAEENILVTEDGVEYLTSRWSRELVGVA